jgi:hypothetical protein
LLGNREVSCPTMGATRRWSAAARRGADAAGACPVEIFAAPHRRRFEGQAGELLVARRQRGGLPRAAAGCDEPDRESAPEGEIGGQPRPGLGEAELHEPMTRPSGEGRLEPCGDGVLQRNGRFRSLQAKRAARGYDRRKGERRR